MATNAENVLKSKKRKKEFAVLQFGGECQVCGYSRCIGALEFHHLEVGTKSAHPTHIIQNWSWERAVVELEKCVLLCANCHREVHYKQLDLTRDRVLREYSIKSCKMCDTQFSTKLEHTSFCSMLCYARYQRKCTRPSKEELTHLLSEHSWVSLGRLYGVSDNAVRKWARSYGLLPKKRIT